MPPPPERAQPDPLAPLARRYGLDDAQREQLRGVLDALAGEERAPTSVRERARALDVHIADSLVALEFERVRGASSLADIGSGAGLPGAVLAIALPGCAVSLVESERRKCEFIELLLARARVTNARAAWSRAEQWREGFGANDIVTARALAPQAVVLEYAAPLLREGGALVDWRGKRDPREEERASVAAAELGLARVEMRRVEPYEGVREHHLYVFEKISPTPERFPRRAGAARKRPLG